MSDEMDHLLTPAQKRARTRERKKQAMLEQMGVEPRKAVKPRRKRKPMTEEQRAAAVERLAKATCGTCASEEHKRASSSAGTSRRPPTESCQLKGDTQRVEGETVEHSTAERVEGQRTAHGISDHGELCKESPDLDQGRCLVGPQVWRRSEQNTMTYVCYAPSYKKDGTIDRVQGTYYPDIGAVWTQELAKEYNGE